MGKFLTLSISLLALLSISSCSTTKQIEALKPEPDDASPLVYENETSFISLPIKIKLKDIENQTNKLLNGLIYEDKDIEDDDIEMKVWKLSAIKISEEKGKIKTVLPLKITVNYRYGINKLGIKLYDTWRGDSVKRCWIDQLENEHQHYFEISRMERKPDDCYCWKKCPYHLSDKSSHPYF
jgi:hypothetical protein